MRTSNVLRIHDGALANASGEKHISLALPSLALRRFPPQSRSTRSSRPLAR
jgi:hypothetical protein